MSHSIYSYLQRRTTEELENILILYMADTESELSREVVRMTMGILAERGVDAVEPASSDSPPDWQAICQGSFSPFSATWYKVSCRTEQRTPFPLTKSI